MSRNEVLVVIPAYNESDIIGNTIDSLLTVFAPQQILVVDDASSDNTYDVAKSKDINIERLEENLGKGGAMNYAVKNYPCSIYLFIDADLGNCASKCSELLMPVIKDYAEMTIADMRAPAGHKGGFGAVKKLASYTIEKYTNTIVSAPLSGQRAIRRELLEDIGGFADGYGIETDLTISAILKGYRILEVPISELNHRLTGRNIQGFRHRAKQFIDILKTIQKNKSKWMSYKND